MLKWFLTTIILNMRKKIKLIILFGITVFLCSACSQKVTIKALEPAQIDRVASMQNIAVTRFKNDTVGLSNKIERSLSAITINGKKYFRVVSRDDFKKVIAEQRLQSSGLVEDSKVVEVGELIGADALISGRVSNPTSQDSYFYEKRIRCLDKKCKEFTYYRVRCMRRVIALFSDVKIVDIAHGDIIFADTMNRRRSYKHCSDDYRTFPSTSMVADEFADSMAREFTQKLTPHYKYFQVKLLEDPDLDYTDKQEELLKASLKYIEQNRYDKAQNLLLELVDSTGSQSYVAFYNLGVIKEAQGKYAEAKEYYEYADNLMLEPVEEINEAMLRITNLIQKREKTLKQMKR